MTPEPREDFRYEAAPRGPLRGHHRSAASASLGAARASVPSTAAIKRLRTGGRLGSSSPRPLDRDVLPRAKALRSMPAQKQCRRRRRGCPPTAAGRRRAGPSRRRGHGSHRGIGRVLSLRPVDDDDQDPVALLGQDLGWDALDSPTNRIVIMAVMGNEEIHPDLRRVAPFVPRQAVYPWSLPLLKRMPLLRPARQRRRRDPDASIRCRGPALPACEHQSQHPGAAVDPRGGGYVIGSPEQDDVLMPPLCREARHHGGGRAPTGWHRSIPTPPVSRGSATAPHLALPACPAWTCTESRSAEPAPAAAWLRPSPSWPATAQKSPRCCNCSPT